MRCPECAGDRTRVHRGVGWTGTDTPYATYALLAVNVIVFLAELGSGSGAASFGGSLGRDGGLFGPAISDGGEWYRIVTSGFLHANLLHLAFNMYVLYVLGTLLEPAIGTVRMAAIYAVGLLGGAFGALLLTPDALTVGASGAIFGLMAATFLIARDRGVQQIASLIGLWVVINLVFTFAVSGISVGGHLGGLLAGGLAALVVLWSERRIGGRRGAVVEAVSLVAVGVLCFVGAVLAAGQPTGLI